MGHRRLAEEKVVRETPEEVLSLAARLRPVLQEYGPPRKVFAAVMTLMVTEVACSNGMNKAALKKWMVECVDALWVDPS